MTINQAKKNHDEIEKKIKSFNPLMIFNYSKIACSQ